MRCGAWSVECGCGASKFLCARGKVFGGGGCKSIAVVVK